MMKTILFPSDSLPQNLKPLPIHGEIIRQIIVEKHPTKHLPSTPQKCQSHKKIRTGWQTIIGNRNLRGQIFRNSLQNKGYFKLKDSNGTFILIYNNTEISKSFKNKVFLFSNILEQILTWYIKSKFFGFLQDTERYSSVHQKQMQFWLSKELKEV